MHVIKKEPTSMGYYNSFTTTNTHIIKIEIALIKAFLLSKSLPVVTNSAYQATKRYRNNFY